MRKNALAACAAVLLMTFTMVGSSLAQSATPASTTASATTCATTTPEENLHIVRSYIAAVKAGDKQTADSLLADNFQSDLSTKLIEVPNKPGNADELQNIGVVAQANPQILNAIAQNDWVAIEMQFTLSGSNLNLTGANASKTSTVDVMAFVRIECGEIAEAHFASDVLEALAEQGFQIVPPGGGQ